MTSLLGLAVKLTGTRPSGRPRAKGEDSFYLDIIQDIADTMAEANNGYRTAQTADLGRMHTEITLLKITKDLSRLSIE